MAKSQEKSLEEVAENTKRFVKLLEMHGANSAEVKAEKKEEKELRNQEKLLQEKWLGIVDSEKKELEKKKQTFTSMTGFIGIETKKYFATTEKNMVTWGGLAGSLKTGIKDWFSATMKQRTVLGSTLRLGASLWKATHTHIITRVKDIFGKIGSQMREVLGDLAEVFDVIKGAFVSVFKFFKDTLFSRFEKVPPHQKRRNKILQKMLNYFTRREKIDLISAGKKKVGSLSAYMIGGMILAAILAGLVRKFLLPFEIIYRSMKIGRMVRWVKGGLAKLRIFASLFQKLQVFKMGMILKFIVRWQKFALFLPKIASGLGLLFKAARFGFKFLGWPIQILFSLYDFVKGFMNTEGNLADKLLGGLKKVFLGFFELPVKLIGWVVEKVLGLFGIKVDGVADKILGFFLGIIEGYVAWLRPWIGFFEGFFSTEGSFIDKLKGGFEGWIDGMLDFFTWFSDKWDGFAEYWGFGKEGTGVGADGKPKATVTDKALGIAKHMPFIGTMAHIVDATRGVGVEGVANAEAKNKRYRGDYATREFRKTIDKQTKEFNDYQKKLAEDNPNIAIGIGGQGGYGGGSPPPQDQTKEEVDAGAMVYNNNDF